MVAHLICNRFEPFDATQILILNEGMGANGTLSLPHQLEDLFIRRKCPEAAEQTAEAQPEAKRAPRLAPPVLRASTTESFAEVA